MKSIELTDIVGPQPLSESTCHGISENYAYKCFRHLGFRAETKRKVHCRPRKEKDKYPNLIYSTWETVDRPRQVIVSDVPCSTLPV